MLLNTITRNALVVSMLLFAPLQTQAKTEVKQSTDLQATQTLKFKVKGMTCPFCSNSLELALKQRPYTDKVVHIDLQEGTVVLALKKTAMALSAIEEDLAKTVKEAAFNYDGIAQ